MHACTKASMHTCVRFPAFLGSCLSAKAAMTCMGVPLRLFRRRPCLLVAFWYPGSVRVRYILSALAPPRLHLPSLSAMACTKMLPQTLPQIRTLGLPLCAHHAKAPCSGEDAVCACSA